MPRPPAPCGTDAAYRRHLRNKEPVDDACRAAHAAAGRASSGRPALTVVRLAPADTPGAEPAASSPSTAPGEPADEDTSKDERDDGEMLVDVLRRALLKVSSSDPGKIAPIAREFRAAIALSGGPTRATKEPTLAEQLAAARAARAAGTKSQGATA